MNFISIRTKTFAEKENSLIKIDGWTERQPDGETDFYTDDETKRDNETERH